MTLKLSFVPHLSEHVDDSNLYDCTGICPLCLSEESRAQVAVIQRNPTVSLLKCSQCKGISASHMPCAPFLGRYYQNSFVNIYKQYDNEKTITFQDEQRFAKHLCRYIDAEWAIRQKNLRIIDFGGGDGALAISVARQLNCKADVIVIDRGPEWIREGAIYVEKRRSVGSIEQNCHIVLAS
ncbi:MAG: hypothetical protein RBS57_19470, partial [Desulforhabdus sp.]|nr:hypothetical protein [Desulforhabdus sp.]